MSPSRRVAAAGVALSMLSIPAGAAPRPAPKPAPSLHGTVTEVYDGQTLQLTQPDGAAVEVRLAGIDAPGLCQSWGPESRAALKDWVLDRAVTVGGAGRVDKGRVAGTVTLEGSNINARMVSEGQAWSQRVKFDRGPYVKEERLAHALNRGLHAQGNLVRPADGRRAANPCR